MERDETRLRFGYKTIYRRPGILLLRSPMGIDFRVEKEEKIYLSIHD